MRAIAVTITNIGLSPFGFACHQGGKRGTFRERLK